MAQAKDGLQNLPHWFPEPLHLSPTEVDAFFWSLWQLAFAEGAGWVVCDGTHIIAGPFRRRTAADSVRGRIIAQELWAMMKQDYPVG